jgi:UDPglucose 6-dehydrogenase
MQRPGVHFEVLSNPEFLAAGTAIKDLLQPDRVIIGSSPCHSGRQAAEALASVYASWVPRSKIITTNVWSSELAKLVANSMLAQRISSINSISAICERTGADIDEVAASIGLDSRIGDKFLQAGVGFGGSCFKKDILSLVYLAESLELPQVAEYWRQVVSINEYQRNRFVERIIACLNNTLRGKKVTILGYAFKKNTDDTRESPSLETIKMLLEEGPAEIAVFDPCCNPVVVREELRRLLGDGAVDIEGGPVSVHTCAEKACHSSNAIIIMTEFDEFRTSSAAPSAPAAVAPTSRQKDPRPFAAPRPSESELLALQRHLATAVTEDLDPRSSDPLQRFREEPVCDADCPDCKRQKAVAESTDFTPALGPVGTDKYKPGERLDWAKIAYHMRKPQWVFDGRGVVNVQDLAKLGVKVETIGRQVRA